MGRENCLFIHVTLVPYLESSREHKSKPTQHSVKELQSFGIMPDIIVARCNHPLEESILKKIALFCNVKEDCVIQNQTLAVLYEAPLMLEDAGLARIVMRELGIAADQNCNLEEWKRMVENIKQCRGCVRIALVGKYVQLHDSYLSIAEALKHAGWKLGTNVDIVWIDSEKLTKENITAQIGDVDGIIIPGGFGNRGIEGMILAGEYARETGIPYFGICLGMQIAAIEFARNVLGMPDADSGEFSAESLHKVIDLMPDQQGNLPKGGTMRLEHILAGLLRGQGWKCVINRLIFRSGIATDMSSIMPTGIPTRKKGSFLPAHLRMDGW